MKTTLPTSPEPAEQPAPLASERSVQVFAVWIDADDMVLPAIPPDVPARVGWAYPASAGWIEVMPPSDADTFH